MELGCLQDKLKEVGTLKIFGEWQSQKQNYYPHLWKAKYAALDIVIWGEAKSHKTPTETAPERRNTYSVSVKVDSSKLENNLKHTILLVQGEGDTSYLRRSARAPTSVIWRNTASF